MPNTRVTSALLSVVYVFGNSVTGGSSSDPLELSELKGTVELVIGHV